MAGQAGFEPATLGFGVRCSVQLELLTLFPFTSLPIRGLADLGLPMESMAATARAELFDLELLGLLLLVPSRHVVAPFTAVACQSDYLPYCRHDRL